MEEANFVLLSAKVTSDKTIIKFTSPGSETVTTKESSVRPHPDLVTEIAKLDTILNSVFKNELMTATGIVIAKGDKVEKITVTGKITFSSGKQAGLSSEAFTKSDYYDFEDDLWEAKKNIGLEVFAYLFDGKVSDTQTKMDLDDTKQTSESDKDGRQAESDQESAKEGSGAIESAETAKAESPL